VTAYTFEDARELVLTAFAWAALPRIDRRIDDVDVSSLDQRHVLPNMGPPNWRGVWYPRMNMTLG
jgi:hypothetical protein